MSKSTKQSAMSDVNIREQIGEIITKMDKDSFMYGGLETISLTRPRAVSELLDLFTTKVIALRKAGNCYAEDRTYGMREAFYVIPESAINQLLKELE